MGKSAAKGPPAPLSDGKPPAPKSYRGTYERGVDGSIRVLLPKEWREVGDTTFLVMVWPLVGPAEYLSILPPGPAAKLHAKLEDIPLSDTEGTALARTIASRSYEIKLDDYGRLPIPVMAAKAVGIEEKVSLVGVFTRFELWSPERHTAAMSRPEFIAQVEKSLAARSI